MRDIIFVGHNQHLQIYVCVCVCVCVCVKGKGMEWNKVQHRVLQVVRVRITSCRCVLFCIRIYQDVMWPVMAKQVWRMLLWEVWGFPLHPLSTAEPVS